MIAALGVLALAVLGGTLATYWYDPGARAASRPFTGAATGLVALAGFGLLTGLALGPTPASVGLATVIVAAPVALLALPRFRDAVRRDLAAVGGLARRSPAAWPAALLALAGIAGVGLLLWLVFDRVMLESPAGIGTGYVTNLGDLPFHLQIVASFAWAGNLPPEDPTYAGTAFTYPFLADYLSGMLVVAGASLRQALLAPNLVLGAALIGVLVRFGGTITRDRLAGWLTPVLVLLGGGLGWVALADDVQKSGAGILETILAPAHDYTIVGDTVWRWGNAITTLLVTQRGMLLGLPLAVVVFTIFWGTLLPASTPEARRLRATRLGIAGLATGALVLTHTHSFVVVLGTGFLLGLLFAEWRGGRWRAWVLYLAAMALVAVPSVLLLARGSSTSAGSYFGIVIGWDRGETDPVTFWLLNTGLFIPLLAVALLAGRVPWGGGRPLAGGRLLRFWLPFLAWFIVPNVVRLAPWTWDNIKVLFYWWVGSAPLVALAIAALWRGRWRGIPRDAARVAAAGSLVVLVLAGSLDVWRVVSGRSFYGEFDAAGVAFSERIRATVPGRALVLHAPTWNPPVYLTGRRSLLGYPGWMWSRGLASGDRERDIGLMYAGGPDALRLLREYGVEYVEVTPIERGMLEVNDALFAGFPLVAEVGDYRLYRVPQ